MKPNAIKPVILVDGSSYFYRAFHALPPLTNSRGEPTGAVFGVLNMIRRLIKDYDPEYMAVIFDSIGKTFRDELFPTYKAHRPSMPIELSQQFDPLVEGIRGLGIPLITKEGIEADDIIGSLTDQLTKSGFNILISTGDKDMAQLVNGQVTLVNTMTQEILDSEGIEKKFGIKPSHIVDYLALIGDKVDNIPGIPNVGPKTALKWLTQYGSIEEVISHADEIEGKVGDNLRSHKEYLGLYKELVTIRRDFHLGISLEELKLKPKDKEILLPLFQRLELKSWLNELLKDSVLGAKENYEIIWTKDSFEKWINRIKSASHFAFDTETTSLNIIETKLVGVSFSLQPGEAAYVPLNHDMAPRKQLEEDYVLAHLKNIFRNADKILIGHNLKYDINVLANYGVEVSCQLRDTMLESYVLNSSDIRHDLNSLALKWLGIRKVQFEEIAGTGKHQKTFNQIELDKAAMYAAQDADLTLRLHEILLKKFEEISSMKKVYLEIEIPLLKILAKMEYKGVLLDKKKLLKQSVELEEKLTLIEKQTYEMAGEAFNLSSPKQLQIILYNKLHMPVIRKTPTGQPSTAEEVLQELAYDYPLPQLILTYRQLSKLKSTYTDALPLQIQYKTGRVHTSYNQAITATGRLSSTDPNLQNIPIRTEEGRRIRQAFISPKPYLMLSADYSQIELRLMAHLSKDDGLIQAFKLGMDIHRVTASEVFGLGLEQVTPEHRRRAKAINFGLIYGMSAFGLSRQLGIDKASAEKYIQLYFERYPGVKIYMEQTRQKAHVEGYVETLYGRRLYLPEIRANNFMRVKAAERAAINGPLQGTAADIIKLAMINIDTWLRDEKVDAYMVLQVHDELVFEVHPSILNDFQNEIRKRMQNVAKLVVPLEIGINVGNNWDEAH